MDTNHYTFKISTNALDDHMDRLYDKWGSTETDPNASPHVDGPHMGVITIVKRGSRTCTVTMTKNAVHEFISDMTYQVEFMDAHWQKAYSAQCKRALVSIKKQMQQN